MNSDPEPSVNEVIKSTNFYTLKMKNEYVPGMFKTHITNTVLFPKINHVIQATPLNQAQYGKLEAPIKRLIKNKYHVNPRLNSTILEDKNFIGMDNVEETHTDNIISNCLVILRSDNIAGKIMRAHSELITNIEKTS